jgi:hypothetical protein
METPTPAQTPSPSSSGVLGTKIPSTVVFTLGVLLFFMPFAEIKCKQNSNADFGGLKMDFGGGMNISNSGFGLAIGKEWDVKMEGLGGLFSGNNNDKWNKEQKKQDPNNYAIAALALGIIGLLLCLTKSKALNWVARLAGILSAAALIGLRIDLDKKAKDPGKEMSSGNDASSWGLDSLNDVNVHITYTPWYYIAVIAMIAAAVFCYLRMKNSRAS